jgi:ammonia channel protein AmtB
MDGPKTSRIERIGCGIFSGMFAIGLTAMFGAKMARPSLTAVVVFFAASWGLIYLLWEWVFITRPQQVRKNVPITSKEWKRRQKGFYDSLPR